MSSEYKHTPVDAEGRNDIPVGQPSPRDSSLPVNCISTTSPNSLDYSAVPKQPVTIATEYVNPTTISFIAAGAGAGAYYVYANVIEPQNQVQRVLQAEQAQKELLLKLEEEESSRRGTNKQTKKKSVVVARPKKIKNSSSDVTPEDVNEKIATSNPFDLLEGAPAAKGTVPTKPQAKKGASKKSKAEVVATVAAPEECKAEKNVKFDPKPEIKELPKTVVSKKERKAASMKEAAPVAPATVPLTIAVAAAAAVATESTKAVQWPEADSPREPAHLHAPEPFKPVCRHRNTFAALVPTAPTIPETFQSVKSNKSLPARKQQSQQKVEKAVEEPPKPSIPTPVVSSVSGEERTLALQEFKALQASVQARDLALAASESRAERSMRKILELQKQIESEAALVKSAQKTEGRAQKLNEKVESLHYINSILVRQLSVEKENLKTTQLQAIKKESELAATAAAAVAAAAETVTKKSPDAEWESKLEALEQERIQRAAQVDHLQEMNRELQQHRYQSETEISQLSRSLAEADHRAENALRERNEVHHQLSMTLSDKEARIASLEADIGALEELENSKVQVEQHAEAVGQAEEVSQIRNEILEGERLSLLEEIDLLRGQLAKDESKVSEMDSEMKKLQEELKAVKEQVRRLEAEHSNTLSVKHEEHQHVLSTKESALAVHVSNLASAQAEVETIRLHQGELEKLSRELEESNTQISTLTESQQSWTIKIAELTERSNESSSKAMEQSTTLTMRIEELEQEMASKESSHRNILTEKEDLVSKLSALEATHGVCKEQHGALVKEKQDLHETVSSRSSELEQLLREKDTLAMELAQKKTAFEKLETAKQGVDAELEALIEASETKKSEVEQEYEALSLRVVELEHELDSLRQEKQAEVKEVQGEDTAEDGGSEKKVTSEEQGHELFNVQVEGLAVASY
ncbi:hypothetical protein BGX23_006838 [Mortierella sp. AD031]|nr:hypothetical protein BGX23_006838 [Mortierella sp. AD031]